MTFTADLESFQRAVTEAEPPGDTTFATEGSGLSAAAGLAVYRHAYVARLVGALRELYPRVAAHLGSDFDPFAERWVREHPPRERSLFHIAPDLADGLEGALAEVAHLDDARRQVFDDIDDEPLDPEALRAIPPSEWPTLRLRRIRASRLVPTRYEADRDPPSTAPGEPESLLVWRVGTTAAVRHRRLDATERALVGGFDEGAGLADVAVRVAALGGRDPEVELFAAFSTAARERWLTRR
jgi:hypothetical protein